MKKNQKTEDEMIQDDAYLYAAPDCSGEITVIVVIGCLVMATILLMAFNII